MDRWALQASYGRIHSPEQLEPDVNQDRVTASAMYDGTWGDTGRESYGNTLRQTWQDKNIGLGIKLGQPLRVNRALKADIRCHADS